MADARNRSSGSTRRFELCWERIRQDKVVRPLATDEAVGTRSDMSSDYRSIAESPLRIAVDGRD
jgi:hypothetical protein